MKVEFSDHCFLLTHSQNEMLNSHSIQETNTSPSWGLECDLFSPYPGRKTGDVTIAISYKLYAKNQKTRLGIEYKRETASMYGTESIAMSHFRKPIQICLYQQEYDVTNSASFAYSEECYNHLNRKCIWS
jgi:hypothetical protein